jgi:glycine/D-amino acid oxidase-like deaminating enzyme
MDAMHGSKRLNAKPSAVAPGWHVEREQFLREPISLNCDTTCDTVIIGGGIVGLALAYHLSKHQQVVVLEAQQIGSGSSGWNAGILSLSTTLDLCVLEQIVGRQQAQRLANSLTRALQETKTELRLENDVWQTGRSIFAASKASHGQLIEEEREIQNDYGFESTILSGEKLSSHWNGFSSALALENEHATQPYKLLLALAKSAIDQGARLFEGTTAGSWRANADQVRVNADGFTVTAKNLIVATGVAGLDKHFDRRIKSRSIAVTGQVLVTKPSARVQDLIETTGAIALWDSLKFYHYVHYLPDGRMLVGGGDAPGARRNATLAGSNSDIAKLLDWAARHHNFPVPQVESAWKASLVYPLDGLPLITAARSGRTNVIHAVTDGLPFGLLLGRAIADLVTDNRSDATNGIIEILAGERRIQGAEQLLALLPVNNLLRNLAVRIGMLGFKLQDLIL